MRKAISLEKQTGTTLIAPNDYAASYAQILEPDVEYEPALERKKDGSTQERL